MITTVYFTGLLIVDTVPLSLLSFFFSSRIFTDDIYALLHSVAQFPKLIFTSIDVLQEQLIR